MQNLIISSISGDYIIDVPNTTDQISSIKSWVEEISGIQSRLQFYFHSGRMLTDGDFYDTEKMNLDNPLQLVEAKILVRVKLLSGQEYSEYFPLYFNRRIVIQKLYEDLGLDFSRYELVCDFCYRRRWKMRKDISKHKHHNDAIVIKLIEIQKEKTIRLQVPDGGFDDLHILDVSNKTTIRRLKEIILSKFNISFYDISIGGKDIKELDWTLEDYKIKNNSKVIDPNFCFAGNMSDSAFLSFNEMANKIVINFSDSAPTWRCFNVGISFLGICQNKSCKACNSQV